jgi:hypothetical protein
MPPKDVIFVQLVYNHPDSYQDITVAYRSK